MQVDNNLEPQLFLGIKLVPAVELSPFLNLVSFENSSYVGKFLSSPLNYEDLDTQERHLISRIKQIIPDFNHKEHPIFLLAVARE